jgi:ferrous iron transport protein B
MEQPPYHLPTLRGLALRTWDRVKLFVTEAGRVILVMVLALNLLNSIGTDGSFGNEDSEHSLLSAVGKAVTPAFAPLGIQEENWPATVGIFTGILAKETVVGTLNAIYGNLAKGESAPTEAKAFELWPALEEAFATLPTNLGAISKRLLDPLGLSINEETAGARAAAASQESTPGLFGAMAARFDGQIGAFAYLLLILLYFPCAATIGAIVREAGAPWAAFVATWTSGVAYAVASLFYQAATFERHPASSSAWILGLTLALGLVIFALRLWAARGQTGLAVPATAGAKA